MLDVAAAADRDDEVGGVVGGQLALGERRLDGELADQPAEAHRFALRKRLHVKGDRIRLETHLFLPSEPARRDGDDTFQFERRDGDFAGLLRIDGGFAQFKDIVSFAVECLHRMFWICVGIAERVGPQVRLRREFVARRLEVADAAAEVELVGDDDLLTFVRICLGSRWYEPISSNIADAVDWGNVKVTYPDFYSFEVSGYTGSPMTWAVVNTQTDEVVSQIRIDSSKAKDGRKFKEVHKILLKRGNYKLYGYNFAGGEIDLRVSLD